MNLFSDKPRRVYKRNPIVQVICQLKFPAILRIDAEQPYRLQEHLRKCGFPVYYVKDEAISTIVPCATGIETGTQLIKNYYFVSEDKSKRINLANNFIAYTVTSVDENPVYTNWDNFKEAFYPILKAFNDEYEPSFYERIGLRYIDAICKGELFSKEPIWKELFQAHVLGVLNADGYEPDQLLSCGTDALLKLDGYNSRFLRLHTGLGKIRGQEGTNFIIDSDFYAEHRIEVPKVEDTLEYLHENSGRFARGCFKEKLVSALGEIK